ELAQRLSRDGYDVVGIDIRKYLAELPEGEPSRDSAFTADIGALIARARAELRDESLPVVVGGHSFGAELAFWIALNEPPPNLQGVLALSPRSSGHLYITPLDYMNKEASGPWAFSTVRAAAEIAPNVRIALIRGSHDKFARHDSAFAAAGGSRFRYYSIPFAGHSLQSLLITGPAVEHAVQFLLGNRES